MIKIEKNVPITSFSTEKKYDFEVMEVGDSFVVSDTKVNSVRVCANKFAKTQNGFKITTRSFVENGKTMFRVWRTS